MGQPDFKATGFQGRKLVRNPSQRLGFAEARTAAASARPVMSPARTAIGAIRPSTAGKASVGLATKIMPVLGKLKAGAVSGGFQAADYVLNKTDKYTHLGSFSNPRKVS